MILISLMLLIGEIVGVQIDLKNIDQNHPNFMKLIDTIIPRIPHIVKKITDLSKNWSMNLNVSNYKRCGPMLDICPTLLAGNGGDCIFYLSSIKYIYFLFFFFTLF